MECTPLDYLSRNKKIVEAATYMIAAPESEETLRSGTWSTIRYSIKLKKPLYIVMPDGSVRIKNATQ